MTNTPRRRFRYARRPLAEKLEDSKKRRPRGSLVPGRSLNPRQQKELKRANHLLSIGDHVNAGYLFEDMAGRAYDRDIQRPSAMLHIQAAHAYLLGEQMESSVQNARRGLELLANQQRWALLQHESQRYLAELRVQHGQTASEVETLVDSLLPQPLPASNDESNAACLFCGAHSSLEPLAGGRAQACRYCGGVVLS